MTKFMLRRLANYLVLVFIATSLAYILAAISLHPKSNYEGRNPRPSEAVISEKLDSINSNPDTPVLVRYGHWLDDVVHGNLGLEVQGGSVNDDVGRRMWVSGQLLLIGTIVGGIVGVAIGAWSAVRQYKFVDNFFTVSSFVLLSIPTFVLAILLQLLAVEANKWIGHRGVPVLGAVRPGTERRHPGADHQPA